MRANQGVRIWAEGQKVNHTQAGVAGPAAVSVALIIPNPKLKLLDQVREVMRAGGGSGMANGNMADG